MSRDCFKCQNERHLINQGYYWCELNHSPMDADKCPDYKEIPMGKCTSASTISYD